jgi:hypothetical protein
MFTSVDEGTNARELLETLATYAILYHGFFLQSIKVKTIPVTE